MNAPHLGKLSAAWRWGAPLLLMAAIWVCSSGRPELPFEPPFRFTDKLIHALVFGLLATAVARTPPLAARPRLAPWWAIVIVGLYAMVDELHQGFTPGRSMDAYDWLADILGATVATFLYRDWKFYRGLLEFSWRKKSGAAADTL